MRATRIALIFLVTDDYGNYCYHFPWSFALARCESCKIRIKYFADGGKRSLDNKVRLWAKEEFLRLFFLSRCVIVWVPQIAAIMKRNVIRHSETFQDFWLKNISLERVSPLNKITRRFFNNIRSLLVVIKREDKRVFILYILQRKEYWFFHDWKIDMAQ